MEFLSNTENIRNICILAHVDHGKTTIADSLISSNGIISHRMAGKMRYLDNMQDEQERGITMKSSSIALKYLKTSSDKYLINLVDTPGHVDFCGEVSAAVRLCDGALIVVDVVEGICPQTKAALEQAWKEGIEPILVFNKLDRLILEQQLDEVSAEQRLKQLLEQVNAIVATLLNTELFEDEASFSAEKRERKVSKSDRSSSNRSTIDNDSCKQVYDWASAIEDIDDDKYYFMPEKNNVVFASSLDDWAFTIGSFADILSRKHKINKAALQKTLWGDYYIDVKQKRIMKNAQVKIKKTLFVSMVLESIWKIYDTVCVRRDKVRMQKICQVLEIQLNPRDINHTDARYQTKLIMSKWLQLSRNMLEAVTNIVPSPKGLSEKRVERLLSSNLTRFHQLPPQTQQLKQSFLTCSSDDDVVKVACISKMVPVERKNLPENRKNIVRVQPPPPPTNVASTDGLKLKDLDRDCRESKNIKLDSSKENETIFIAFARIFSGNLRKGDKLYVLGPRHDPSRVDNRTLVKIDITKKLDDLELGEHVTMAVVENCYLLMGREIEKIDCARAGNIVGIQGLDKHLIRTATLSSDIYCPPFNDLHMSAQPILRVAIEPKNPLDMSALVRGLKLLNQADPCVEVRLQQTGEHVIIATGEVHLEHCIKDLRERYADDIELNVSPPIVPFRETIVLPPKTDMVNETIDDNNQELSNSRKQLIKKGAFELLTPNKRCKIKIKASPLPENVVNCLSENSESLKVMAKLITSRQKSSPQFLEQLSASSRRKIEEFKKKLTDCFVESRKEKSEWRHLYEEDLVDHIWAFGPKYSGPNILVASQSVQIDYSHWSRLANSRSPEDESSGAQSSQADGPTTSGKCDELKDYLDSFISGFELASQSGPLCEEPMMGVCFTILDWSCLDPGSSQVVELETMTNNSLNLSDRGTPEFQVAEDSADNDSIASSGHCLSRAGQTYGPMSGQIISTVKECCRKAFQMQAQRLMSPMFSCDIQVTTDVLGKMYAVLGRRNGRILHGDMREGSQTFEIKAFVPVIESLDFVSEIRKQTSGLANPQLIFSHYELIDVDPFWKPNTEEEYALYGEKADTENQARKYMNLVRRRKGLAVQEKIVEHAEKQRTIKRNK